jgi:hypothetical protein
VADCFDNFHIGERSFKRFVLFVVVVFRNGREKRKAAVVIDSAI